MMYEM